MNKPSKRYILSKVEFAKFMKDKTCYYFQCGWIEKWNHPIENYIPCNELILSNRIKFKLYNYPKYSDKCLSIYSVTNRAYRNYKHWYATIGRNGKIYIREYNAEPL